MSTVQTANMSRREKYELLQALVRDLAADEQGIEKTEGVCGGSARIANTRISVWVLENARRLGTSEADLLIDYPSLTASDLANAWNYVAANPDEIEREIAENETA